jgi:hypothetical protein
MIDAFPKAKDLIGDREYDADWLCAALADRGIAVCIPSKVNRKAQMPYDTVLYRRRHKSRTCSEDLRIGGASTHAMTGAHTPSCPPSASPQP